MFNYQDVDKDWKSYHYSYHDSPYLSAEEIEKVKLTVDPLKFAREYEASFEDSGANVFTTLAVRIISILLLSGQKRTK